MNQQIKTSVGVGIILIIAATVGVFTWKAMKVKDNYSSIPSAPKTNMPTVDGPAVNNPTQNEPISTEPGQICSQEAKICPDGTPVTRTGPNCEFAACPGEKTNEIASWKNYTNEKYGFSLQFPDSWVGFKSSQKDYPAYSSVSFSFENGHQPFSIFSIIKFNNKQWKSSGENPGKILSKKDDLILVCDGCCGDSKDFAGGGQFDKFQIEKCKEATDIIATFELIN